MEDYQPLHFLICTVQYSTDPDNVFMFMSTKMMLQTALNNMRLLCIDATYKICWRGFPLVVLGTTDAERHFYPIATVLIHKSETADIYEKILETLQRLIAEVFEVIYVPENAMIDGADSIANACEKVFSTATRILRCDCKIFDISTIIMLLLCKYTQGRYNVK
jgi:hypothetical protein